MEEKGQEKEKKKFLGLSFKTIRNIIGVIAVVVLLILTYTIGDNLINNTVSIDNAIILPISIVVYLFCGYDLFIDIWEDWKEHEWINEEVLTLIATIAAFCIQEYVEALAVLVFFQIGESFEDYALNKSKSSIKEILKLRPDFVRIVDEDGKEEIKQPEEAKVGDVFLVNPGEKVPLDGVLLSGSSSFDYSSMTGESVPLEKNEGDEVLSGVINKGSPIKIRATKEYTNSTVAKILDMVENVEQNKAKPEKFMTRFAKYYTPIVVILAILVAIIPPLCIAYNDSATWMEWIRTGASFLVISCPCALVISVPMSYFVGMGIASKNKILVKGSNYLELVDKSKVVIFDKTGTITKGTFEVTNIEVGANASQDNLIKLASYAESYSNHPIAQSILAYSNIEIDKSKLSDYEERPGFGVVTSFEGKQLLAGNAKLMDEFHIDYQKSTYVGTNIYVAYDGQYIGCLTIKDVIKPTSKEAIASLKKAGFTDTYMLTGDNQAIAEDIANQVGVDHVYYNLLPLDKTNFVEKIQKDTNEKVMFVGDGVNDSPSLVAADVGVSMGSIGSDAAIESSNVVIMDDDLNRISILKKISKSTNTNVIENIVMSVGFKVAVMILSLVSSFVDVGIGPYIMWFAIFADVGVTVLCCINSLRMMLKKFNK